MNFSDHIINFMLAVLLHVLGLLVWGSQMTHALELAVTSPKLEVTSIEVSIEEPEIDSPPSPNSDVQPSAPNLEPLPLPQPAEPVPAEVLPDKPDFTEALTPPPMPVLQPEPSPVVISLPAPSPTPSSSAPVRPVDGLAQAAASPAPSGPPATIQAVGAGGGASGRVDAHPSLERAIKPNYPISSRRRGEEGTVILDVTVATDGKAAKVVRIASSGFPDLDQAAERAAARALFKPGTRDGKPVESVARLTLIFRLRDA